MDHVFGEAFLDRHEQGWDAMVLHFRDGSDLAIFRTRPLPGQDARRVGGAYVSASGAVIPLEGLQTRFYPLGASRWTGVNPEGSYPLLWRVEIPSLSIKLDLEATVMDQEISAWTTHGSIFWRGSVEGRGRRGDYEVSAAGYLELMGYGRRFPPAVREGVRRPVVALR
jgi:predicted secreted hydrolase